MKKIKKEKADSNCYLPVRVGYEETERNVNV